MVTDIFMCHDRLCGRLHNQLQEQQNGQCT
jgi:hypothetical protein